jgi:hypothetical protein
MKLSKDARYSTTIGEINQQIDDWHEAKEIDPVSGVVERIDADKFWQSARDIQKVNNEIKRLKKVIDK